MEKYLQMYFFLDFLVESLLLSTSGRLPRQPRGVHYVVRLNFVPASRVKVFYDAVKNKGVEATLHIVKGQGHGFRDPETDKMVAGFFDKRLRKRSEQK